MANEQKKLLLIIEDDEVLLRALHILFHEGDYTIASAVDGDSGLKMAQRLKPDIILLDLLLPKMDGFEVLSHLKSDPILDSIPVIVLSNLGDDADVRRAKSLGADDYFVKAKTDLATLVKKIKNFLA